jgi:CRP-like cAMP-binding protein
MMDMLNSNKGRAPRLTFSTGSSLIPPATAISLVIETGWVGIYNNHRIHEKLIGVLLPGDRIEPLTAWGHCSARALTSVMVRFDRDLETTGQELNHILLQCARHHLTSSQRVMDFFAEIYDRLEKIDRAKDGEFTFPLRYSDLSTLLSITPVHLSRVLKQLRDGGYVTIDGHNVRLLRRPRSALSVTSLSSALNNVDVAAAAHAAAV